MILNVAVTLTPARDPLIVAFTRELTLPCLTLNVAKILPAAIGTVDGSVAAVLELDRLTFSPPVGAGPVSVTVPITAVVALPFTVVGFIEIDISAVGTTVTAACTELEPNVAVTTPLEAVVTALVVAEKVPEEYPAIIFKVTGTVTHWEAQVRFTVIALDLELGVALRATVPVKFVPPVTVDGENVSPVTRNGVTCTVVVWVILPSVAVIVTFCGVVTLKWVTAKVAVPNPLGTVAEAGTETMSGFELLSFTVCPLPTTPLNATLPVTVTVDPPTNDPNEIKTD